MLTIQNHIVPQLFNINTLFERVMLKKMPEFMPVYENMVVNEENERIAFDFFKDLLTRYTVSTIVFFDNNFFEDKRDSTSFQNHYFSVNYAKTCSREQLQAISQLRNALFVASFIQKSYENDNTIKGRSYFPNIPESDKNELGLTELDSDCQNLFHHFWRLPFMISTIEVR